MEAGEAKIERFRATMRRKRELKDREIYNKYQKRFNKLSKKTLFVAGLMLYLGEGDKRRYERIVLANTDPKIIKFFIKWITDFLGVTKENIKVQLHLHKNMDIEKETMFWKNELGLPETHFYKPAIREPKKGSYTYKESSRHGTCGIYILGVEKKREVMMAIQAFLDKYMRS